MRVTCVIPARRNSQRIPLKNFKSFAGGPSLTERAVLCAQQSGVCRDIVVSSDAPEAQAIAQWCGVVYHQRSAAASSHQATAQDALREIWAAVEGLFCPDALLWLQPTSPLRTPGLLQRVVGLLEGGAQSVVTVQPLGLSVEEVLCLQDGTIYPVWNEDVGDGWYPPPNPADRHPAYRRDGLCYGCLASAAARGTLFGDRVLPLVTDSADAISIDTEQDWDEAERRMQVREWKMLAHQPSQQDIDRAIAQYKAEHLPTSPRQRELDKATARWKADPSREREP